MKKKLKIFTRAKIFLSVFLCVFLLGSNFVFANGDLPVFSSAPSVSGLRSSPVYLITSDNSFYFGTDSDSVDYYYYYSSGNYFFVLVSVGTPSIPPIMYSCNQFDTSVTSNYFQTHSNLGVQYRQYSSAFTESEIISNTFPYLGEFSGIYDSLTYYSQNGVSYPSDSPTITGSFDLQVGNITFIDLGSSGASYDLTLKSYFNKLSGTLSGGWEYDNRRYGFASDLPDTSFSVDSSSGSGFLWTKTDPKNILGRSHYGLSEISGNSSGRYLWIVNPLYNENYYNDNLSGDSINGRINISGLPAGCTFYTYPLVQSATSISLASDVATTSGGTGTVSETGGNTPTVSIDDPNSSYTQPIGGDNSAPEEVTLQEGVNQLFQTLKDFTEKVINLLSAPADFIQQLISAGQGFTQAIASMFTWLPQTVQDVLIAALGVMIVVGFLKLLF